jgi:hypothetical protein
MHKQLEKQTDLPLDAITESSHMLPYMIKYGDVHPEAASRSGYWHT